ncbi:peptidoglycan-associated lipoprotein Pal [Reinekea marinisedimentorum]|uniref:Peptidoglycan-associated lipoprotein n=1 Tax=Reinekea marinisedimentorum TaxID=230495 RepID=A0A4R3I4G6_9GAMM|nr:peptidoglycan-associated lipoprotein Pal [Reinekea marinisedimentorum]TCS40786.1 peptidoglycan-associated lipoprotein [Reinekea marinisedimentorum]
MAKSKLLTAAALSSALILVACGGNTQDEDATATTTMTETDTSLETVLETEETIALEVEQVEADVVDADDMMDDMMSDLMDMTLVFFEFDKFDIKAEYRDMLDAHAAYLAKSGAKVVLEGHADERGTREYNLALGELRAKQVAAYLQVKGVSASQIDVVSYGEEKPLAIGKTEAEYSQNRRVEFVY